MLRICILAALAIIVVSAPAEKENLFPLYTGQTQWTFWTMMNLMEQNPNSNIFLASHSAYHALLIAYFGSTGAAEEGLKNGLFLQWANSKSKVVKEYKKERLAHNVRTYARVGNAVQFKSVDKLYFDDSVDFK